MTPDKVRQTIILPVSVYIELGGVLEPGDQIFTRPNVMYALDGCHLTFPYPWEKPEDHTSKVLTFTGWETNDDGTTKGMLLECNGIVHGFGTGWTFIVVKITGTDWKLEKVNTAPAESIKQNTEHKKAMRKQASWFEKLLGYWKD